MDISKRTVEILVSPLGIMVALMGVGLMLSFTRRCRTTGRRMLMAGVALYLIFLFSPLAETAIRNLEQDFAPMLTPPRDVKIGRIVVLAGYGQDHPLFPITSNLSEQTLGSLVEGIRLYRLLPRSKVVLSGGVLRAGDRPVAAMMADFLVQMGLPPGDVVVEGRSGTTYENLVRTKELVGTEPFILVATACDLRRAVAVARKLGMRPMPAPACVWALQHYPPEMSLGQLAVSCLEGFAYPSHERLSRIQWAYHEYLGYFWYRLLRRV